MRIRAVFDCNIYLQAAARGNSVSAECLRLVERGHVQLFVSETILSEIEDVLTRPEIRSRFRTLSDEVVDAFLLKLRTEAQVIRTVPNRFSYPRDPNDEPYVNLAIETKAEYLVSRDNDLLDLMTSYSLEGKEFRRKFRPLRTISPAAFLKLAQSI